jgi:hypothetical protein
MVAVPRDSGKARRQANPLRAWPADATQPEIQEGGGAPSPHLRPGHLEISFGICSSRVGLPWLRHSLAGSA